MGYLRRHAWLWLVICASLPLKWVTAQNMPWEIDIVPVVSRNTQYLLPPVGTLSSVAAYNLPMLSWLHLPMQHLTGDVWWTIVLTLWLFSIVATVALYQLTNELYDQRAALVAVTLFTFSEVGVSSTYTAWAQLLLPGYSALLLFCLWRWVNRQRGVYLALAGIVATIAFGTHFSAILYFPAMLVFALFARAIWQWKALFGGAVACLLLLMPYLHFEMQRDFVDVIAFARQTPLVDDATLRAYQVPPVIAPIRPKLSTAQLAPAQTETTQVLAPTASRWSRAIDYAWEVPHWYWRALIVAFDSPLRAITHSAPTVASLLTGLLKLPVILLVISLVVALWRVRRHALGTWQATPAGRTLLLLSFLSVMIIAMIVTRTIRNSTYWMSFITIEIVIASYAIYLLPRRRWLTAVIVAGLLGYMGIQTVERVQRLQQHDDQQFSVYNVSLYRHVAAAVDYIAADWQGGETLTVSYDLLPEVPNLWWTPAWHQIDPHYSMGMPYDFLLAYHHGLTNRNQDPIGTVAEADYVVIYRPALSRYPLDAYDSQAQFGAIVVLKR